MKTIEELIAKMLASYTETSQEAPYIHNNAATLVTARRIASALERIADALGGPRDSQRIKLPPTDCSDG